MNRNKLSHPSISATIEITPQFFDIDPMDVVWHGNYARFFEAARSELLNSIQYNYTEMLESGYAWPIVDMRTKYIKSIRLHQTVLVAATLVEFENRLKINYVITDKTKGTILTKATTIQLAVNMKTEELEFETPSVFQNAIKKALP